MDLYREQILEHWQNPQNYRKLEGSDVIVVEQINPLCGDEIVFYFKITNDKFPITNFKDKTGRRKAKDERRITDVSFEGKGCAISIAAASMFSEAIKGRTLKALEKITGEDIFKLLGGSIAAARLKCAFLPLEAVRRIRSLR